MGGEGKEGGWERVQEGKILGTKGVQESRDLLDRLRMCRFGEGKKYSPTGGKL